MKKFAYYNEIDPYAAQWLRNLIEAGHIPPGVVDERSIKDVVGSDLSGFSQCHFFAGIGVWAHALRRAGWADDRQVWTGSCPCQPFSVAGKGAGFDDERHLWPEWIRLIRECGPRVVFGEQVASRDGLAWLDAVHADLEGAGYAVGAFDLCAAGVGAPHIRQRLYFAADRVGHADDARLEGQWSGHRAARGWLGAAGSTSEAGESGGLADDDDDGLSQQRIGGLLDRERPALGNDADGRGAVRGVGHSDGEREGSLGGVSSWSKPESCGGGGSRRLADDRSEGRRQVGEDVGRSGSGSGAQGLVERPVHGGAVDGWMADADRRECDGLADGEGCQRDGSEAGWKQGDGEPERSSAACRPRPTNGLWRDADWLFCRDGFWRPVKSGSFPLADGAPSRVGRLRAYGNAIVAPLAEEFIRSYLDVRHEYHNDVLVNHEHAGAE